MCCQLSQGKLTLTRARSVLWAHPGGVSFTSNLTSEQMTERSRLLARIKRHPITHPIKQKLRTPFLNLLKSNDIFRRSWLLGVIGSDHNQTLRAQFEKKHLVILHFVFSFANYAFFHAHINGEEFIGYALHKSYQWGQASAAHSTTFKPERRR